MTGLIKKVGTWRRIHRLRRRLGIYSVLVTNTKDSRLVRHYWYCIEKAAREIDNFMRAINI